MQQEECSTEATPLQQKSCGGNGTTSSTNDSEHVRQPQDAVQCYDPPIRTNTASSTLTSAFLAAGKELGRHQGFSLDFFVDTRTVYT